MIAVTDGHDPGREEGRAPRHGEAAREGGRAEDGDVVLSFRPELGGTMAYPHIQMGSTHSSLVYTKNGEAFNVDSPLDDEYVGHFSTKHFVGGPNAAGGVDLGTDALHVRRPIGFDDALRPPSEVGEHRRAEPRVREGPLPEGLPSPDLRLAAGTSSMWLF